MPQILLRWPIPMTLEEIPNDFLCVSGQADPEIEHGLAFPDVWEMWEAEAKGRNSRHVQQVWRAAICE